MPTTGPLLLERPIRLAKILELGPKSKADKGALVSAAKRVTWRELDEISDRLAGNYLALGLKTGDRLASFMPNRVDLVIHYLACFKAGLVATPLNYRYMAPEIDYALEVTDAAALLAHEEGADDLAASKWAGSLPLGIIGYGDDGGDTGRKYTELTTTVPASVPPPPEDGAPAVIFFTSGSTGKPKGVTATWRAGKLIAPLTKDYGPRLRVITSGAVNPKKQVVGKSMNR